MKNYLGEIIFDRRKRENITQDEYGARYNISGPAVFKFEKGYIKPSLEIWLRIAKDAGVPEGRAVLLWIKARLPEKYQEYIEVQSALTLAEEAKAGKKNKMTDYAKLASQAQVAEQIAADKTMPQGLRELVMDNELRSLYDLTGGEINQLRDVFGPLGRGSKEMFRDALRVMREFTQGA